MGKGFGHEKPGEGKTNDWLTPPALVERLGRFDLDPCSYPSMPWKLASVEYKLPESDGLLLPWEGRVWCNPPYGPHVSRWVEKMALHGNGMLLIFARTETKAWESVWKTGDAFLFPLSRFVFRDTQGKKSPGGTAPSVLVAYGPENVEALRSAGIEGAFFGRVEWLKGDKASSL